MFYRNCPICNIIISCKSKWYHEKTVNENKPCQSCNMKKIWKLTPLIVKGSKQKDFISPEKTLLKQTDFIKKAKNIHNNFFNYDKVNFITVNNLVEILCPIHGLFLQTPLDHLRTKHSCPNCSGLGKLTNDIIDERCLNLNIKRVDNYI